MKPNLYSTQQANAEQLDSLRNLLALIGQPSAVVGVGQLTGRGYEISDVSEVWAWNEDWSVALSVVALSDGTLLKRSTPARSLADGTLYQVGLRHWLHYVPYRPHERVFD